MYHNFVQYFFVSRLVSGVSAVMLIPKSLLIMSNKKRNCSENYVQYDFACAVECDGTRQPQFILCNVKLSNSSLMPVKLQKHFTKIYGSVNTKTPRLMNASEKERNSM